MLQGKIENPAALFQAERGRTVKLASTLEAEDTLLQSMPDASPAKWHLAHTTWFFEEFLLARQPDYRPYDPSFRYLFNSYYETVGERQPRPRRGMLSRPALARILDYRSRVDSRVRERMERASPAELEIVTLGIHHEMQHQELLLTDILHAFSLNPLLPAVFPGSIQEERRGAQGIPLEFHRFEGGLCEIGSPPVKDPASSLWEDFAFDCEKPRHTVFLHPFAIANRAVTNGEWMDFIEDGGYRNPAHWLSDGWAQKHHEGWEAPLYWRRREGEWRQFGLTGLRPLLKDEPVCHVSYYEADAYARWAGYRLPTEQEWEHAASAREASGSFLDSSGYRPRPATAGTGPRQMYGDVWEWTRSPFAAYPGFKPAAGALGEYNGKFMSGQFVLRGGSCVSNRLQLRPGYRNFFYPHQRWQFSGLRLAGDA